MVGFLVLATLAPPASRAQTSEPANQGSGIPLAATAQTRKELPADLVDAVNANAWYTSVTKLAGFQTRRSLTPGNEAARDWILDRLEALGLEAAVDPFDMEEGTSANVVGELPGRTRPQDLVIVGAHFDSTSPQASTSAPGAEDNASGTAAILEMARILRDFPPEATLRFVAFSGEEQGLLGSSHYVQNLSAEERERVQAAIVLDMVGFTSDAELDVLLETYAWAEGLRAVLRDAAREWTSLVTYDSNNPYGSDHMPFLRQGIPTVLLIQNEWDNYPCYHKTCDVPKNLSRAQGQEIMKMLVVALAELAGSCHLADANCDGQVDVLDIQLVASHWNSIAGEPDFDVRRDLDHDRDIDLDDIMQAVADWGWTAPKLRSLLPGP